MSANSNATRYETFHIPDMDCPDEFLRIRRELEKLPGVVTLQPNYPSRTLRLRLAGVSASRPELEAALRRSGFPATAGPVPEPPRRSRRLAALLIGALLFLASMLVEYAVHSPFWSLGFATLSVLVVGLDVFRRAIESIRHGRIDMHVLMSLAVTGALVLGESIEAGMAMLLFVLAHWIEDRNLARASNLLESLGKSLPALAHRLPAGAIPSGPSAERLDLPENGAACEEVAPDAVRVDDLLVIRPFERVSADGVVVRGFSSVDESMMSGEGLPSDKGPGSPVYAGTMNGSGALVMRVTANASASVLAGIQQFVRDALDHPAPVERFIERFSRWYTPLVVSLAVAVALGGPLFEQAFSAGSTTAGNLWLEWAERGLILLVTACPCAFVIATPLTMACGLRRSARLGALIKGGVHLESLAHTRVVAFDKTGTLTAGDLTIREVQPAAGDSEQDVLRIAAAIEAHSNHPLARTVVRDARKAGIDWKPACDVREIPGMGLEGRVEGRSVLVGKPALLHAHGVFCPEVPEAEESAAVIHVAAADRFLGRILIAARIKDDARDALLELRRGGVQRCWMLTGDHPHAAKALAEQLGIDEFRAELTPREKAELIDRLRRQYQYVAMIGDGFNDGPALAQATVGLAIGQDASSLARASADIVLLGPELKKVAELFRVARATYRRVWENVLISLFLKAAVVLLTIMGWGALWLAVAADVGASLLVIANGMRILRV